MGLGILGFECTFDWLFGVEVMDHKLDPIHGRRLLDIYRKVLDHYLSRNMRQAVFKSDRLLASSSTDINEEYWTDTCIEGIYQPFFCRVHLLEERVSIGPSIEQDSKTLSCGWFVAHDLEQSQTVLLESFLNDGVLWIRWILVVRGLQKIGNFSECWF